MNGYKCFWKGMEIEILADSAYGAQQAARPVFQQKAGRKKVIDYDINVVLCEVNGEQYYHSGGEV